MYDMTNLCFPNFTGIAAKAANGAYEEFAAANARRGDGDNAMADYLVGIGSRELTKAWRYQNEARRASRGPVISGGGNVA